MVNWTHTIAEIYRSKLDSALEEWEEKGWELVSLTHLPAPSAESSEHLFLAVFKKQAILD